MLAGGLSRDSGTVERRWKKASNRGVLLYVQGRVGDRESASSLGLRFNGLMDGLDGHLTRVETRWQYRNQSCRQLLCLAFGCGKNSITALVFSRTALRWLVIVSLLVVEKIQCNGVGILQDSATPHRNDHVAAR